MNNLLPYEAVVIERIQESETIVTLRLCFTDPEINSAYQFRPGQFNMLYLHGVGEVPISIVSDPRSEDIYDHTIRTVGRVSLGLGELEPGDTIGVRGPYGRGWPLEVAAGKDIIIITGGLGCAPVVSVINYIMNRHERFGKINIVQGIKHSSDLIWKDRYDYWRNQPDTKVLLTADRGETLWPWHIGPVTGLFDELSFNKNNVIAMMCGPEGMMRVVINSMQELGIGENDLWLSMERNMQCAIGRCGHCQYGEKFICKDGPVFCYKDIKQLFHEKGF